MHYIQRGDSLKYYCAISIVVFLILLLFTIYIISSLSAESIDNEKQLVDMDAELLELYIDDVKDYATISGYTYGLVKDYKLYSSDIKLYNCINKMLPPPFMNKNKSKRINKDKVKLDKKFKNISQKIEDEYNENITRYL